MISSLDRKLLRDLWDMKGQALAIAMVIASGVATFVMSLSTLHSLQGTQATYYGEESFAEMFASLKRAPVSLEKRIAVLPGVAQVQTRVVAAVNLDIEGFSDPATGQLVSLPDHGEPLLNRLHMKRGRTVDSTRDDEVVVSDSFAQAHGFRPGDRLHAIINGKRKRLTIVGTALSPEFIYQIGPGTIFPDFEAFAILWMARTPLATAYDLDGAFNDVALTLTEEGRVEEVIDRLDDLLEPYGGLGAYGRKDQLSHRYLSEEFRQLTQMATMFPVIFLGVAAFLLNIVLSRLISTQREQIAVLKAFGYSNLQIGVHYAKMVLAIVVVGIAAGVLFGMKLGQGMGSLYMEFYRFPYLLYELRPSVVTTAAAVTIAASGLGTLHSLRQAALMPPAEAMRPEPPAIYREALLERLGLKRWLAQPTRMIARHIERRPIKSLLTVVGIALACAIMVLGSFFNDAIEHMIHVQFSLAQREDVAVTFVEPTSRRALYEFQSLPGVQRGEVFRVVPVRLRHGHRTYRTSIQGFEPGGDLQRLLDDDLRPIELPPAGIVLTDFLGEILDAAPGDVLTVEVLEGGRPVREVPVAGLVSGYIGVSGYMQISALNRMMREGAAISGCFLAMDADHHESTYQAIKGMPRVAATVVREKSVDNFYETMGEHVLTFAFFNTLLAGAIAFGVVYNSARIDRCRRSRSGC